MINKDECQNIGYVFKTHGVDGELVLAFEIEEFNNILEKGQLFIEIDGYLVPFFIDSFRNKNNRSLIVKFIDISKIETAEQLIDKNIFTYSNDIKPIPANTEYSSFVGFCLKDNNTQNEGEIIDFVDYSGNKNFIIVNDSKEFIIPANSNFIDYIDYDNKVIIMNLPEGLFDLN